MLNLTKLHGSFDVPQPPSIIMVWNIEISGVLHDKYWFLYLRRVMVHMSRCMKIWVMEYPSTFVESSNLFHGVFHIRDALYGKA